MGFRPVSPGDWNVCFPHLPHVCTTIYHNAHNTFHQWTYIFHHPQSALYICSSLTAGCVLPCGVRFSTSTSTWLPIGSGVSVFLMTLAVQNRYQLEDLDVGSIVSLYLQMALFYWKPVSREVAISKCNLVLCYSIRIDDCLLTCTSAGYRNCSRSLSLSLHKDCLLCSA